MFGSYSHKGADQFFGTGPQADAISQAMIEAWTSFARDGKPRAANIEAPAAVPATTGRVPLRLSVEELARLEASGVPVVLLDVRKRRPREESGIDLVGTTRLDPDDSRRDAARLGLSRDAWLVCFCA